MWSAFVTGAAEEATKIIKEENKAISERVIAEMERTLKKRQEAEEAALTKRDEARKQAEALKTLSGGRLTQTQIVGILSGGEAETVIKQLRQRTVGPEKLAKLFTPANPDDQAELESYLQDVGKLTGTVPPRVAEDTGAFGLPTRAGRVTRERALAKTGLTEEELYKTRMTTPTGVEGRLDLSIFKDEESVSDMQDKLIKTIIDPSSSEEEKDAASKTLGEIGGARALLKAKEEGVSFKESDIRANLRNYVNTIKERMAGPGNTKRVPNPETNSVDIIYSKTVKPDEIRRIESAADTALNGYINQYYSVSGKIPEPVQRVVATFTARPMAIRSGAGGAGGAAGEVPAPTGKPTKPAGILPSPKTKEEYDAIPSGTRYIDTDGKTKIKS